MKFKITFFKEYYNDTHFVVDEVQTKDFKDFDELLYQYGFTYYRDYPCIDGGVEDYEFAKKSLLNGEVVRIGENGINGYPLEWDTTMKVEIL
jgi:hypothetical protein